MQSSKWHAHKVHGRDKVLREIEKRANAYGEAVVRDIRGVMHDYEVDMYRLVLMIGKRYGMEPAFEIMSDTVAEKRLRWVAQTTDELQLTGTVLEQGLDLYCKYFNLGADSFQIMEQDDARVLFRRKDYIDAIATACDTLGLDVIEVNNKVYARTMNLMFASLDINLTNTVLEYGDGWYVEVIEEAS